MRNDSAAAELVHAAHGKIEHCCSFLDGKELFHSSKTVTILTNSSTLSHSVFAEAFSSIAEN